jgi:hypothetical protein
MFSHVKRGLARDGNFSGYRNAGRNRDYHPRHFITLGYKYPNANSCGIHNKITIGALILEATLTNSLCPQLFHSLVLSCIILGL